MSFPAKKLDGLSSFYSMILKNLASTSSSAPEEKKAEQ
jgi:hypothetical protein